jgi:uncharacterized protein (DUF433 family)
LLEADRPRAFQAKLIFPFNPSSPALIGLLQWPQPAFKGTRIMVWIVLEQLEDGMTWQEIVREWDGRVSEEAIGEAIAIADVVVKHEPFKGFNVGAGRKPARRATALAA